jgi:D-3-phosphoglycerate dehydrogenase / 2-oxoglutarate reductase
MSKIVLATDPIHAAAADLIAAAGYQLVVPPDNSAAALKRSIPQADALIVRSKLPDDALETAACLRGIVRHGVGLDFIPMHRAAELAIPVANVPGGNSQSVAEYVFGVILDLTRHLRLADAAVRAEGWQKARAAAGQSLELNGKCLGVVGLGNVGRRVAAIGAAGFGMEVVGTDPHPETIPHFVRALAIEDLFAVSDFVVLSCPLTPQTEKMVGAALLGRMKRTAYLINSARGQLIDEAALVSALRQEQIAGAALDVFAVQPLPHNHPFCSLPNVLLTPHVAGLTADSMARIGRISCEEVLRLLRGERPLNLANPEIWTAAQARWQRLDAAP